MSKPYDIGVVVGRFQILHYGHIHLIEETRKIADKTIIFTGHSGFADMRHMLSVDYVRISILKALPDSSDLIIKSIYDAHEDSKWVYKLEAGVNSVALENKISKPRICFVGSKKDVVWYTNLLPNWNLLLLPPYKNINATDIRKDFYLNGKVRESELPQVSIDILNGMKLDGMYKHIVERYKEFYSLY